MPARKSEAVTPLPDSIQQETAAGSRNFLQEDRDIKEALEAQPKRRILISQVGDNSSDDPMPDVPVTINGYTYVIKRDEEVEVPESVAEVLIQSSRARQVDEKGRSTKARPDLTVSVLG